MKKNESTKHTPKISKNESKETEQNEEDDATKSSESDAGKVQSRKSTTESSASKVDKQLASAVTTHTTKQNSVGVTAPTEGLTNVDTQKTNTPPSKLEGTVIENVKAGDSEAMMVAKVLKLVRDSPQLADYLIDNVSLHGIDVVHSFVTTRLAEAVSREAKALTIRRLDQRTQIDSFKDFTLTHSQVGFGVVGSSPFKLVFVGEKPTETPFKLTSTDEIIVKRVPSFMRYQSHHTNAYIHSSEYYQHKNTLDSVAFLQESAELVKQGTLAIVQEVDPTCEGIFQVSVDPNATTGRSIVSQASLDIQNINNLQTVTRASNRLRYLFEIAVSKPILIHTMARTVAQSSGDFINLESRYGRVIANAISSQQPVHARPHPVLGTANHQYYWMAPWMNALADEAQMNFGWTGVTSNQNYKQTEKVATITDQFFSALASLDHLTLFKQRATDDQILNLYRLLFQPSIEIIMDERFSPNDRWTFLPTRLEWESAIHALLFHAPIRSQLRSQLLVDIIASGRATTENSIPQLAAISTSVSGTTSVLIDLINDVSQPLTPEEVGKLLLLETFNFDQFINLEPMDTAVSAKYLIYLLAVSLPFVLTPRMVTRRLGFQLMTKLCSMLWQMKHKGFATHLDKYGWVVRQNEKGIWEKVETYAIPRMPFEVDMMGGCSLSVWQFAPEDRVLRQLFNLLKPDVFEYSLHDKQLANIPMITPYRTYLSWDHEPINTMPGEAANALAAKLDRLLVLIDDIWQDKSSTKNKNRKYTTSDMATAEAFLSLLRERVLTVATYLTQDASQVQRTIMQHPLYCVDFYDPTTVSYYPEVLCLAPVSGHGSDSNYRNGTMIDMQEINVHPLLWIRAMFSLRGVVPRASSITSAMQENILGEALVYPVLDFTSTYDLCNSAIQYGSRLINALSIANIPFGGDTTHRMLSDFITTHFAAKFNFGNWLQFICMILLSSKITIPSILEKTLNGCANAAVANMRSMRLAWFQADTNGNPKQISIPNSTLGHNIIKRTEYIDEKVSILEKMVCNDDSPFTPKGKGIVIALSSVTKLFANNEYARDKYNKIVDFTINTIQVREVNQCQQYVWVIHGRVISDLTDENLQGIMLRMKYLGDIPVSYRQFVIETMLVSRVGIMATEQLYHYKHEFLYAQGDSGILKNVVGLYEELLNVPSQGWVDIRFVNTMVDASRLRAPSLMSSSLKYQYVFALSDVMRFIPYGPFVDATNPNNEHIRRPSPQTLEFGSEVAIGTHYEMALRDGTLKTDLPFWNDNNMIPMIAPGINFVLRPKVRVFVSNE